MPYLSEKDNELAVMPADAAYLTRRSVQSAILVFLLYFGLVVAMQFAHGAQQASFNGYPDEPAHYLSGRMVHDYLSNDFPHAPKPFATQYYLHVPYFAIGYWPPLFYIEEALWMCAFGTGRGSALALIAAIAAASAMVVFAMLRPVLGAAAAFAGGLMFLMMPAVEWSYMLVMTDLPVALWSVAALAACALYLKFEKTKYLAAFAFFAAFAILTKSSGLYLLAVPPGALIVLRRWRWLTRVSFWLPLVGAVVICAPWFAMTREYTSRGLASPQFAGAFVPIVAMLFKNLGFLSLFAAWGAWGVIRGKVTSPGAAVCFVAPVALAGFLAVAPVSVEPRYLTSALAPLIVLAGYGIWSVPAIRGRSGVAAALMVLAVAISTAATVPHLRHTAENPQRSVADFIAHHEPNYRAVMVSADEGAMIAEIVEREHAASDTFLLRPAKLLARVGWMGQDYSTLYQTPEQVQGLFQTLPLDLVVIRVTPSDAAPHLVILRQTIEDHPDRWRQVYPANGQDSDYAAYEPTQKSAGSIMELQKTLQNILPTASVGR